MKKPALLFLIILIFSFFCLFTFGPSKAQSESSNEAIVHRSSTSSSQQGNKLKQVPEMIENSKSARVAFERRELFQSSAKAIDSNQQLREVLSDGVTFDLDKPATEKILQENAEYLTLPLPDGKGGTVELELVRVDIFAPGFRVTTSKPTTERIDESLGVHYRGIVKGNDHSLAAISIFKDEVMGFYSTEADGNSILGRLGGDNPTDKHVLYAERDLRVASEVSCDTQDTEVSLPASVLQAPEEAVANCIRIYIEADYDLFLNKGSVANTASYLTGIFNQSATLFANDGIPISLSEIFVWNIQSPYAGLTTTGTLLNKFQETRNSFNGDLGHLVALRGSGGLAASFDAFCNTNTDNRQCFSGITENYSNVPSYSSTIYVFTHEMGHLMGSRHTHACAWNGNNTAIDGCGPTVDSKYIEGSCAIGPLPPSNGGTIMSYCHQVQGVGINFNLGFGTQPRNVITSRFNSATCLAGCGTTPTKAQITSPANGSTLSSSTATFTWGPVSSGVSYYFDVGNTQGSRDIYGNFASGGTTTVAGLPTDGRRIYVRLWTFIDGAWQYNDYSYLTTAVTAARITSPTNGATFGSSTVTFTWSPVSSGVTYYLDLSNLPGSRDIFANYVSGGSTTLIGVPVDGRIIYVRLWSLIGGVWSYNEYTYRAASSVVKAAITSPVNGSTFASSTVTFTWGPVSGAVTYFLDLNSSPGSRDIFAGYVSGGSTTLIGVPADGRIIYVRLWSLIGGVWQFNEYAYRASTAGSARISSPVNGSTFTSSTVTFTWNTVPGASQYFLDLNSSPGSRDIFANYVTGGSTTITGIPADGRIIYVRMWTNIGGVWVYNAYTYTARRAP